MTSLMTTLRELTLVAFVFSLTAVNALFLTLLLKILTVITGLFDTYNKHFLQTIVHFLLYFQYNFCVF